MNASDNHTGSERRDAVNRGIRRRHWLALIVAGLFLPGHGAALAQSDRGGVRRLREWVLPEFKVKDATLREGLEVVRLAWTREHPAESFPVILLESERKTPQEMARTSLDFKNAPAIDVIGYLAYGTFAKVYSELDVVVVRPFLGSVRGRSLEHVLLRVSDRAAQTLGLSPTAKEDAAANEALKKRLVTFGVEFSGDTYAKWSHQHGIFVRNTAGEISRLKGLLLLLDSGFTVQKEEAK